MTRKMLIAMAAVGAFPGAVALAAPAGGEAATNLSSSAQAEVPVVPTGLALQAGGGVTGFTRQGARDVFDTGGYWDVRGVVGTRSYVGGELAYLGSARKITAAGVSDGSALLGNGAEAVARANLPLTLGNVQLTPFLFGGVGWTYYSIANNDAANTSGIKDHANAFVVPFGAGASLAYEHLLVDARFTYRAIFDDKLVPTGGSDHLDLQNWSAGVTVGYLF
jgi:hypothetical protein